LFEAVAQSSCKRVQKELVEASTHKSAKKPTQAQLFLCLETYIYIHTLFKPIRVYTVNEYKNSRIHSDAMAERRALKPLTRSQIKNIQIVIQI